MTNERDVEDLLRSVTGDDLDPDERAYRDHRNRREEARATAIEPSFLGVRSRDPVRPGENVNLVVQPQLPFRLCRLYVVAECLDFTIMDIRIGNFCLFVSYGNVPAEAFARTDARGLALRAVRGAMEADATYPVVLPPGAWVELPNMGEKVPSKPTVQVGMNVTTCVRNDGREPCVFRAAYLGEALFT